MRHCTALFFVLDITPLSYKNIRNYKLNDTKNQLKNKYSNL
ncbi:hypothetical protein [Moraxella phage Mcat16]|nr:hypothetical protein [Moraxella phage Mcat16]